MKKLSGWQKAGIVAGGGCLSIVALLVLGVIGAVVWARYTVAQLGDTTAAHSERAISLPTSETAAAAADGDTGGPARDGGPYRLTLELQEGSFTIRPDAEGRQVQVEGTWAPGLYEVVEDHEAGGHTTIRFRSKGPAWARFFASFGGEASGGRPEVTVRIPPDVPVDLALHVSMGESRIDLGGLTLGELDLDLSMGDHRVDFAQPLVEGLRRLQLDASMGNVSVENIGNARPAAFVANGSMGNLTADFGGAWTPSGGELTFDQSMGELTLRVPSGVRLETSGIADSQPQPGTGKGADAPLLRLRVSTSMGESRVVRY